MPTYEYECKSCTHTFEAFQAMSDEPIKICPRCGKEVRRLIYGGTGVIFKGSGFYVTDKKSGTKPSKPAVDTKPKPNGNSVAADAAPAAAKAEPASKDSTASASSATKPQDVA